MNLLFGGAQLATGPQQLGSKQTQSPALGMLPVQGLQVVVGDLQIPLLEPGGDQLQQQVRVFRQAAQLPAQIETPLLLAP